MKNKFILIIFFLINIFFSNFVWGNDQFNFDVTEIEITENGNKYKGIKGGKITTDNGIILRAKEFEYNKYLNILEARGNVDLIDKVNNVTIKTNLAIYLKNEEKILTKGKSIATQKNIRITAENFEYNKILNIINANQNVKVIDEEKEYVIFADNINYFKNVEKIVAEGNTKATLENRYNFFSEQVIFLRNQNLLRSLSKSYVSDRNEKLYKFDEFEYLVNQDLLKAENIEIISENLLENGFSDKAKFSEGMFKLKKKEYIAGYTEFFIKKNTLGRERNDPRLIGISSSRKDEIIEVKKGAFTSCEKKDDCPPWTIKADKIKHDLNKKQLIYEKAILEIYNKPVFYFPKFFHPDPSVERQSGILRPAFNDSEIIGSSFQIPYFHVISPKKDLTFTPTFFEDSMFMLQNEYRQKNESSTFIADFNYLKNYKSNISNDKNSITHLFSKYFLDLDLDNFTKSTLNFSLQKVSNDTYLKVFDGNLTEMALKPGDKNNLTSNVILNLNNENFDLNTGIEIYENLGETKNNDRYQFVFPYYNLNFSPIIFKNGLLNFYSTGNNRLINTNNLKTKMVNDLVYETIDNYTNLGLKNNLNVYLKNVNRVSKKDTKYRSSPQAELSSIFEFNSSFPLSKIENDSINYLIPKLSLRYNPTNMNDNSSSTNNISIDSVFGINRLGLSDTFESGKSLTMGLDYKKEDIKDVNKYFEIKLASVLRDKKEKQISSNSTIDRKTSNLFGAINSNFSEFFNLEYNFAVDNDLVTFESNNIKSTINIKNLTTEFNFNETNGEMGDTNVVSNTTSIKFNDYNYLKFNTRRNRKISLTEYYDLIYEYKNDCLSAGIKYKKTYYNDRELRPKEDLILSLTIFPISTYEHEIDQSVYRGPNSINDLFDDL